jgi:hypothetical protein
MMEGAESVKSNTKLTTHSSLEVKDMPPNQPSPQPGQQKRLLLGLFHGVPTIRKNIFDLPMGLITSCFVRRSGLF